ncbi:MAG TPA: hypothetical protein VFT29_08100 [Gemmatimonadaceae bacterium]|nr:hypothetical protein [Gemmatimonadaceae bacterium]
MSHLSTDRLAALADEQPTAEEKAHLLQCEQCATELNAHRSIFAMAGSEREAMQLPLTRWETLSPLLRREGLVIGRGTRSTSWFFKSRVPLQAAAGLLLIAGGMALGRVSAGKPAIPGGLSGSTSDVSQAQVTLDSLPTTFASLEEAKRWRGVYADAYQRTVSFLAANDSAVRSVETPAVMRARLSAMDRVQRTMREALNDAPYDPVINDFYLNSFGQREATLRQLNTVLPQSVRLTGF